MTDKVPFAVEQGAAPKLNIAKIGEVSVGAIVSAGLVWGIFTANFEHTAELQKSYIELLQHHHAAFLNAQKEYHRTVHDDMRIVTNSLEKMLETMEDMREATHTAVLLELRKEGFHHIKQQ